MMNFSGCHHHHQHYHRHSVSRIWLPIVLIKKEGELRVIMKDREREREIWKYLMLFDGPDEMSIGRCTAIQMQQWTDLVLFFRSSNERGSTARSSVRTLGDQLFLFVAQFGPGLGATRKALPTFVSVRQLKSGGTSQSKNAVPFELSSDRVHSQSKTRSNQRRRSGCDRNRRKMRRLMSRSLCRNDKARKHVLICVKGRMRNWFLYCTFWSLMYQVSCWAGYEAPETQVKLIRLSISYVGSPPSIRSVSCGKTIFNLIRPIDLILFFIFYFLWARQRMKWFDWQSDLTVYFHLLFSSYGRKVGRFGAHFASISALWVQIGGQQCDMTRVRLMQLCSDEMIRIQIRKVSFRSFGQKLLIRALSKTEPGLGTSRDVQSGADYRTSTYPFNER